MSIKLIITLFFYVITGGAIFSGGSGKFRLASILAGGVAIGASFLFWRDVYDEAFDFLADRVKQKIASSESSTVTINKENGEPFSTEVLYDSPGIDENSKSSNDASYSFVDFIPIIDAPYNIQNVYTSHISEEWDGLNKSNLTDLAKFSHIWDDSIETILAHRQLVNLLSDSTQMQDSILLIQSLLIDLEYSLELDGKLGPKTIEFVRKATNYNAPISTPPSKKTMKDIILRLVEKKSRHSLGQDLFGKAEEIKATNLLGAYKLYERSCSFGHPIACRKQGILILKARKLNLDSSKSKELFNKSCVRGDKKACLYGRRFTGDRDAQPLTQPNINYPSKAKSEKISGECEVQVSIDTNGKPVDPTAKCTNDIFVSEVIKGISLVEFSPKVRDGQAVRRDEVIFPIVFNAE